MGQLAEHLKPSNGNNMQVEGPSISSDAAKTAEELKNMKNAVRDKVRSYAETVKEWDQAVEKDIVSNQNISKLFPEPTENTGGSLNLVLIVSLVIAVVTAATMGFLFTRESALRKQVGIQLNISESEQARLRQNVARLKADVERQEIEIEQLTTDLRAASLITNQFDQSSERFQMEKNQLKSFYEAQIASLKGVIQLRDDMARTLQADLEEIKRLLGHGVYSATVAAAVASTPLPAALNEPGSEPVQPTALPVAGNVLAIDHENRFIVMDIGQSQGAVPGKTVQIYRDGIHLGNVRVDRNHENLSAASVESDDLLEEIQEGDQAILI